MNKNLEQVKKQAEAKVAASAPQYVDPDPGAEFEFVAGKPLPEGFENPKPGKPFHRCVDSQGLYNPQWSALILHKRDKNDPAKQFCGAKAVRGGKVVKHAEHYVQFDTWMDAPPAVIMVLEESVKETTDMRPAERDPNSMGLTSAAMVAVIVDARPRFHMNVVPSA